MPCEQKNQLEISNSKQDKGTMLFSLVIREVKIETLRYCFSPRKRVEIFVIDNINLVNKDVIKLALLHTNRKSINGYHFSGTHSDIQNAQSLMQCAYFLQFSHKKYCKEKIIGTNIFKIFNFSNRPEICNTA